MNSHQSTEKRLFIMCRMSCGGCSRIKVFDEELICSRRAFAFSNFEHVAVATEKLTNVVVSQLTRHTTQRNEDCASVLVNQMLFVCQTRIRIVRRNLSKR